MNLVSERSTDAAPYLRSHADLDEEVLSDPAGKADGVDSCSGAAPGYYDEDRRQREVGAAGRPARNGTFL